MLLAAAFAFTSCNDSKEEASEEENKQVPDAKEASEHYIDEYTEHLNTGADILNNIGDNKDVDSNLEALKAWVSDGNDLDDRMKEFDKNNKFSKAEADEIAKKYEPQITKAATAYGAAMAKATIGKNGAKVADILKDMK